MRHIPFTVLVLLFLLIGCSEEDSCNQPQVFPPSDSVKQFVEDESFTQVQNPEQHYLIREIEIFSCRYGEGRDCPSGCIYDSAVGLRYGDRVGWLIVEDHREVYPPQARYFDFDVDDTELFKFSLWSHILTTGSNLGCRTLLQALASDEDTSREALVSMTGICYSEAWPRI